MPSPSPSTSFSFSAASATFASTAAAAVASANANANAANAATSVTITSTPSSSWRPVSLFDQCHTPFTGPGTADLARLVSDLDADHELVANTPHVDKGLVVLADRSGNIHVASLSVAAVPGPRAAHDAKTQPPRNAGPSAVPAANAPPAIVLESFPAADVGMLITAVAIAKDPRAAASAAAAAAATVPAADPATAAASVSSNAMTLLIAAQDRDGTPLVRVIQYTPTTISSTAALPSSAPKSLPFRIVRDLRISLPTASALTLLSLGRVTATGGGQQSAQSQRHPLGRITHMALGTHPVPSLLVGFDSLALILFKGDIVREKPAKQLVLREPSPTPDDPISGMTHSGVHYFVTTQRGVWFVNSREQLEALDESNGSLLGPIPFPAQRDEGGVGAAEPGTAGSQVLVVQNNGLTVFCAESGRNQTYPTPTSSDHAITHLSWLSPSLPSYLALVSTDTDLHQDTLTILHLDHKLLTYASKHARVLALTAAPGGNLLLLTSSTSADVSAGGVDLTRIKLKPPTMQLAALTSCTPPLFPTALALADDLRLTGPTLADLHGAYATYILSTSSSSSSSSSSAPLDPQSALPYLLATIGTWPASRVIRLLTHRGHAAHPLLVAYLQSLHARGVASAEHTELLFRSLIRARDLPGIQALVRGQLPFDVHVASACLVQGDMCPVAVDVALRAGESGVAVDVLVYRMREYARATEVLMHMEHSGERRAVVAKVGKYLADKEPALVAQVARQVIGDAVRDNTLDAEVVQEMCGLFPATPLGGPASEFVLWLVVECVEARKVAPADVWNAAVDRCVTGDEALRVVQLDECRACVDQVLATAKARGWVGVMAYVYEQRGDVLGMVSVLEGVDEMMRAAVKHAPKDQRVWSQVLCRAAGQDPMDTDQVTRVIEYIDAHAVMSPVAMLRELARYPNVRFSLVRDVFARRVTRDRAVIAENEDLARAYRAETHKLQAEARMLEHEQVTFQGTACFACGRTLGLPAVHFFCKHSFHVGCLNNNSQQCPKCYREHRKVGALKKAMEARVGEDLGRQLETAADGFAVVADWFSRREIR